MTPIRKNNQDVTSYLWEDIPRPLWTEARALAMGRQLHMKDLLKSLLENWVREELTEARTPLPPADAPSEP